MSELSRSERLLALYPDLPLDREKAEVVTTQLGMKSEGEKFVELPADATVKTLLDMFRLEISKEKFLWSYIEAVTGEKDIASKVY